MVIIQLLYGLGNQMFQYALGRCLAEKRKDKLILDASLLTHLHAAEDRPSTRSALQLFNIKAPVSTLSQILGPKNAELIVHVVEPRVGYYANVFDCCCGSGHFILRGSWQSHKYFVDIDEIIREDFTFAATDLKLQDPTLRDIASGIDHSTAVAVHVRRGDYISSRLGAHLGFVGREYYATAFRFMAQHIGKPHFFIFSDDLDWCTENLRFQWPHTYVKHSQPVADYTSEDLYLMSRCKHFIIANSTYSWWAAWLGKCPEKIVVAPRRWFQDPAWNSRHIVPDPWVLL
jgi:hypothetical protein